MDGHGDGDGGSGERAPCFATPMERTLEWEYRG